MTATLMIATSMTACGSVPLKPTNASNDPNTGALTYISMRINPEIEMVADENGEIVSVNPVNADAEVVLTEIDLVGQTVAEAGETFTKVATELGYLDADSEEATVYIDAEGENEALCEKLENNISDSIHKYFDNNGIFGKVSPETLDQYADKAAEWGLSTGQVKMVIRLLDLYPEMTEEQALGLTSSERMALIKESGKEEKKVSVGLRDEMKAEVDLLKEKYAATFALGEEIKELRRALEDETLTEEDKTALEAQIVEKQADYDEQMKAYRDEVKTLKDSYREKSEENRDEVKQKAKEKREQNADKMKAHKEKFEADSKTTQEKIKEWRGRQENVQGSERVKGEKPMNGAAISEGNEPPEVEEDNDSAIPEKSKDKGAKETTTEG
ncbi:MAG: hypothetical protein IJW99_06210 [Clostridia bacterium]|nr:hypothetical protein [Clostridia bacterium]